MEQLKLFEVDVAEKPQHRKRDRRVTPSNLDIAAEIDCPSSGMPIVAPSYCTTLPQHWQLFTQAVGRKTRNVHAGVLCFQDDYKIERIWNNPYRYCSIMSNFPFVASPDYSLYEGMPMEMQRWNVFRSRLVAAFWQRKGINVFPTISWSDERSFEFCFDGVNGGTVVISTLGSMKREESKKLWKDGATEMMNRIKPDIVILYGPKVDFDFGETKVIHVDYISKKGGLNYGR